MRIRVNHESPTRWTVWRVTDAVAFDLHEFVGVVLRVGDRFEAFRASGTVGEYLLTPSKFHTWFYAAVDDASIQESAPGAWTRDRAFTTGTRY